ncbi:MAG: hypothetical protein J0M34_03850 [Alphaproteobacteria bacterium]|nr:hypothetical protein [Alphaproteobacteria bacterium]
MAEPLESLSIPELRPPNVEYEAVAPIVTKLKSQPPEPITMGEAHTLLHWTVALALQGLENLYDSKRNWIDPTHGALPDVKTRYDPTTDLYTNGDAEELYHGHPPDHWGRYITNKCVQARDLSDAVLSELPKSMVTSIHTNAFSKINHGILVLKLPIEEHGEVTQKHFLVDPTIAQFFYDDNTPQDDSHKVGEQLLAVNEAFARELVSQGFSELSEPNAELYVNALGVDMKRQRAKHAMAESKGSYLDFLQHPEFAQARVSTQPGRF